MRRELHICKCTQMKDVWDFGENIANTLCSSLFEQDKSETKDFTGEICFPMERWIDELQDGIIQPETIFINGSCFGEVTMTFDGHIVRVFN